MSEKTGARDDSKAFVLSEEGRQCPGPEGETLGCRQGQFKGKELELS